MRLVHVAWAEYGQNIFQLSEVFQLPIDAVCEKHTFYNVIHIRD